MLAGGIGYSPVEGTTKAIREQRQFVALQDLVRRHNSQPCSEFIAPCRLVGFGEFFREIMEIIDKKLFMIHGVGRVRWRAKALHS